MKDSSSQPYKKKKKQQPKRIPSKASGKKSKAKKQSNEKKEKASLSRRDEFPTRVALTAQSFRKHATTATTKTKDTRVAVAVAVAATKTKSCTIPLANDDSSSSTHKNHPEQQRQQRQQQNSCTTSNKKKLVKLWQQHPNIIILTFLAMGLLLLSLSVVAVMGHVRNNQAAQKQASRNHGNNNRPVPQYANDDYYFTDHQDEKHDVDIFGQPQESNAFVCGPQIWPHLLGVQVNEARDVILQQNPCVYVFIVMMDDDNQQPNDERYDPERVRLYMDKDTGTVAHVPRVG